jgi:hypothetical protein
VSKSLDQDLGIGEITREVEIVQGCLEGVRLRRQPGHSIQKYDPGMHGDMSAITVAKFPHIVGDEGPTIPFNQPQQVPILLAQQADMTLGSRTKSTGGHPGTPLSSDWTWPCAI